MKQNSKATTVGQKINSYMKRRKTPVTTSQLFEALSKKDTTVNQNTVRRTLVTLTDKGEIKRKGMKNGEQTWVGAA